MLDYRVRRRCVVRVVLRLSGYALAVRLRLMILLGIWNVLCCCLGVVKWRGRCRLSRRLLRSRRGYLTVRLAVRFRMIVLSVGIVICVRRVFCLVW